MRRHSTVDEALQVGLQFTYRQASDATAPLIVLIHGRAGNRDVMWLFERVLPQYAAIVSFQAPEADAIGGYSWWDVRIAGSAETGAPLAARLVGDALERFERLMQLAPARRVALGFSQGAALLSSALLQRMLSVDGVGLLAGFVVKEGTPGPLFDPPSVFMAHGSNDDVIPISRAYEGRDVLLSMGYSVEFHEDSVGHKVGVGATKALGVWVERVLRIAHDRE